MLDQLITSKSFRANSLQLTRNRSGIPKPFDVAGALAYNDQERPVVAYMSPRKRDSVCGRFARRKCKDHNYEDQTEYFSPQ
jgi:hypothetical protein